MTSKALILIILMVPGALAIAETVSLSVETEEDEVQTPSPPLTASCPQRLMSGFCVNIDPEARITKSDLSSLEEKLLNFQNRFPKLMKSIADKGYKTLTIKPREVGETGGTVLAQVDQRNKQITLYRDFFSVAKDNQVLQSLPYSVSDVALLHEFIHAHDENNELVRNNLKVIGWDIQRGNTTDGFRDPHSPQLVNTWIKASEVAQIKSELGPSLRTLGPWTVYLQARAKVMKSGYPTIYSALGGPIESFAELGAYVALDPKASSYIPSGTINWFRQNVLQ